MRYVVNILPLLLNNEGGCVNISFCIRLLNIDISPRLISSFVSLIIS